MGTLHMSSLRLCVYTDYVSNSTLISNAGSLLHIGQFFFDEAWNDQVYAVSPYTTDTNNRTLNVDDDILAQENTDGNNAYIE